MSKRHFWKKSKQNSKNPLLKFRSVWKWKSNLICNNISKNIIRTLHTFYHIIQHCQLVIFSAKILLDNFEFLKIHSELWPNIIWIILYDQCRKGQSVVNMATKDPTFSLWISRRSSSSFKLSSNFRYCFMYFFKVWTVDRSVTPHVQKYSCCSWSIFCMSLR